MTTPNTAIQSQRTLARNPIAPYPLPGAECLAYNKIHWPLSGDRVVLLSSRPGRVAAEFAVDIDRPRRIESPEVSSLAGEITARLRQEVRRHAG